MTEAQPIIRADGITAGERYLKRLCDRTFLSLWSYPGIYRDQGRPGGKGDGKELCDLLVVFDDHVIIFSDKDCAFPETGDLKLDWRRWYRRAVKKGADQVWGAERWIRGHPERLFLDRACTEAFPLELPDPPAAKIHRVVVAHGAAERWRRELNGSASLLIVPDIKGDAHCAGRQAGGLPLAVGQIDPARGFVHVLDDASLDVVLGELDTITDFVRYLSDKEDLILGGRLAFAAGEDDLLAHYLFPAQGKDRSGFVLAPGVDRLFVGSGAWEEFDRDGFRVARAKANSTSYLWDRMIEAISEGVFAGTQVYASHPGVRGAAATLRLLARESRTRRRTLSGALAAVVVDASAEPDYRAVRVCVPTDADEPHYAILLLSPDLHGVSHEQYREIRRDFLTRLCNVVKLRYPAAGDIVGIATETGTATRRSFDVVYREDRDISAEYLPLVEAFADEYQLLTNVVESSGTEYDYPHPGSPPMWMPFRATPLRT